MVIPPEGSIVGGTVEVSGYARTFESNVLIIATAGDELVAETNVTAADSESTWGEFEATVELPLGAGIQKTKSSCPLETHRSSPDRKTSRMVA